jgi:hypothetical protein
MKEIPIPEKIRIRIEQLLDDMAEANPRERVFMAQAVKELYLSLNLEGNSSSTDWLSEILEDTGPKGPKPLKDND